LFIVFHKIKKFIITLSEYDKYNLVRILYENIDKEGNYLSDFYKTLDILDAGFMSDRKEEAHIMFREIINVSVIESEKEENFKIAINEFLNNEHINYTIFKKKIIGEFVIQIPYYEFENLKKGTTNAWIEKCSISDIRLKKKIKRWTDNIYIINSRATNQDNNFENSDEKERDNII
jgi:CRISPR-associated endonuclease/helicase Cas3